jgi:protein KRI1
MEKQMASLRKDLGIKEGKGEVDWDELEKVMEGDFDEDEWQRVVGKMLESRDDEVSSPLCLLFQNLIEIGRGRGG